MRQAILLAASAAVQFVPTLAQLAGRVGPTTSTVHKGDIYICDVTDYGATSTTDFGVAFVAAWDDCAGNHGGGLVYIPPGNYPLRTAIKVKDATTMAVQWDGTVYRDADIGGNMVAFTNCADFELFSGNSKGAFQGYGWEYLKNETYGGRFFRFTNMSNMSLHGLTLVDSPSYYVSIIESSNVEVYNMLVRGVTTLGETDAFDVSGSNIWIHDVEVSNGDECVTVKSPAKNFLIESIYCNLSGGTAIGSLGTGTDVSNIEYKNLYMNNADACYLKTNNGNGTVKSVSWDTVYINGGSYILAVNEAWNKDSGSIGVQISELTFKNWYGYNTVNSRPTIRLECDPDVPCYDITLSNVNLWTESGSNVKWSCFNSFGSGACLRSGSALTTYTSVTTVTATPTSYKLPATMPGDLTAPLSATTTFTIPPMATSFFPGLKPRSTLLSYSGPVWYSAIQGRGEPSAPEATATAAVKNRDGLGTRRGL
ncbi:rhamnogalacturonase A precursor [Thozetella sp. PMI_491]|nr:rhamnogalacturonase A precursor [Thozetella sp. PMI_491]